MADEENEELTYMPALRVEARAAGGPSDSELMTLARAAAPDPSVFDEHPPRFFNGVISTNAFDAYDTSMDASTLKAFAAWAERGVSYLTGHNNRVDPTGHSIIGTYIGGNGDGKARTRSYWYIAEDESTRAHVTKLRAGVVKDLSVGFSGGYWECSICGKDMSRGWWSREGCPHMLGVTYTPTDEAGKKSGESKTARATIKSTEELPVGLHEYSGVYDGATPGAMVTKAMDLAGENYFTEAQRGIITARYRIALPERRIISPGVTLSASQEAERSREMPDEKNIAAVDPTLPAVLVRTDELAGVRHLLKNAGVQEDLEPREAVRALAEKVLSLTPAAEDGRAYRSDLVTAAKEECVRAGFDGEAYADVLVNASLPSLKRMRDDWKAIGDKNFATGRQTKEDETPAAPVVTSARESLPDAAFRTR